MEFNEVIKKRRMTREFSNKEVQYCDIEAIIEAGSLAPTCNHLRQWDFVIIDDRMIINILAKCVKNYSSSASKPKNPYEDMCNYAFPRQQSMIEEAQFIILPIIKENSLYKATNMFSLMHFADTWCAIENMFLKATELGLGCSMHVPSMEEQNNIFNLIKCKKGYALTCIIGIGYPSETAYYPEEIEFDRKRIHRNRW
ncbi:nitroreductase family protein [Longibaculum muris]|uniref:Nitroreductase n=1 Tax=Longibaculum muris TaxID=1796628 RepID=A0A4R3YKX4_9FIRM|nr:nitroreductase family protein [Longibaculum muris]KXU52277.1 nitroreductase family protein [Candidatus Stoquefichus sp. KLE1796]MBS5370974.1 nitroreductase family protein [Coprobacillus cateniformis]MCR1886756.1 nitroreductase family protein [Longibaculum muris]TCV92916.1 nitroreductase [Longibaculum muris]